jgi:prepilin signal peptidase PulO-like enzyme (type II secretory pathway)
VLEMFAVYQQMAPLQVGFLIFPLGLAVGSFSSVLLHRLPARQSIVHPRSHCPHCQHTLGPLDLVPVVSYLWNQGRCRHCRTPVSASYLLLELGCGLATALAGAAGGWLFGLAFLLVWLGAVTALALRTRGRRAARDHHGHTRRPVVFRLSMAHGDRLTPEEGRK